MSIALGAHVAVRKILTSHKQKCLTLYTVISDGDLWKWRVSYPNQPGKIPMVSTTLYPTRAAAERAATQIAAITRPSIVMHGTFDKVSSDAGQPAEHRADYVGV